MWKQRIEILLLICILTSLIFSGCGSGTNNGGNSLSAKVFISPASGTISPGDTFTHTVKVEKIGKTFYAAFDMTYDPNIIQYVDATEGTFLNRDRADATFFQTVLQDNKQGRIIIGLTRLGTIGDVSGNGTLLTLTFRAVNTGATSLSFANPKGFKNNANQDVAINHWENGIITVE